MVRTVTLGLVLASACGPAVTNVADDASGSGSSGPATPDEGTSASATSTGAPAPTTADADSGDTATMPACAAIDPTAVVALEVRFPGSDEAPPGSGELERHVQCTVDGRVIGPDVFVAMLLCNDERSTDVEYEVELRMPVDPFEPWIYDEERLQLDYMRWWRTANDAGQAVRLTGSASTRLVAYEDYLDGVELGSCSTPRSEARVRAGEWLSSFPASIADDACEVAPTIPIAVPTSAGELLAYPGSRGVLADEVSFVYPPSGCHTFEGGEQWIFSAVLWR